MPWAVPPQSGGLGGLADDGEALEADPGAGEAHTAATKAGATAANSRLHHKEANDGLGSFSWGLKNVWSLS